MSSSAARACPTTLGSSSDDAASGHSPRLTNGRLSFALVPAYTRSQCRSMVVPMPTAGPHTAATSGLGNTARVWRKRKTGRERPASAGVFWKSPRSLPALNTRSLPWTTTTRTSLLSTAASSASASAVYISFVSAFFLSSRLMVMVSTPASTAVRTSLIFTPESLWLVSL